MSVLFNIGDHVVMVRPVNAACATRLGNRAVITEPVVDPEWVYIRWLEPDGSSRFNEGSYSSSQFDLAGGGPW